MRDKGRSRIDRLTRRDKKRSGKPEKEREIV